MQKHRQKTHKDNLLGSTSKEAKNPLKYTGWDVKPRKLRDQYTMIDNIKSLAKIN